MAEEFKAITTQEEFDAAIKDRLARQEKTIKSQFADYDDLKGKVTKFDDERTAWQKKDQENADKIKKLKADLETANATIKSETVKSLKASIAAEMGLPSQLKDRLTGSTEDEIRKDAESLKEIFSQKNREGLPGFNPEKPASNSKDAAYKNLLDDLKK
ncbi:MAG: DUF4355 domain-containing protein [Lachnospiraceae bacterium]|nr:DUF4355 domain-containing protein [Lachnospiraceae bacterium]